MTRPGKIRVLIADDHPVARSGIKGLLAGTPLKVVAEAATGRAAVKQASEQELDLVLMAVRMPQGDGLTALRRIKRRKPDLPVVMFSAFDDLAYLARAVALGASGYLLKGCTRDELLRAIRSAARGEKVFTRDQLRRAAGALAMGNITDDVDVPLSPREVEVLRQIARGLTNKGIAKRLRISYETVKDNVRNILPKIGLTDRTQAAVWALRKGLV
jgi:DNA-binding NarL/FixJ family response regulator